MDTYYARHTSKIAVSDDVLSSLRERNRIAIHYPAAKNRPLADYPDSTSLHPGDYEGSARSTLQALNRLATEGGYLVAHYRNAKDLVAGTVRPGSRIVLERCTWSTKPGREAVIKTLAYENPVVLPPSQQRLALACAPRQSTLTAWHAIKDRVKNLVEGTAAADDVSSLHTSEQEVLCEEFLREPTIAGVPKLVALTMPIGRTMPHVDICGFAEDGKPLYAQVKYDHKAHYVRDLEDRYSAEKCHLLLFSGRHRMDLKGRVLQLPLTTVYHQFRDTPRGAIWFKLISAGV